MPAFDAFFSELTGHESPRPWQQELANEPACRDRLIRIPTGLGKTEGVLAAWSFHRVHRADDQWPRRLVWCLPMRVLVEQTVEVANGLAAKLPELMRPIVHVAMGGEDVGEWFLYPELPAVIIGTQDMLLSRALNRGYGAGRARWPIEFGLLSHDALWLMDEVQLMDVGLATSAQLQAFREQDQQKGLRPCHTWWMSATLQPEWLRSVDTAECHAGWVREPCVVAAHERRGGLWDIRKSLALEESIAALQAKLFTQRIQAEHAELPGGEYGRITLVVCNTVDRACQTFDALQGLGCTSELRLVHSRFRPTEREAWREQFLSRSACRSDADRIIVATQVVEAGVDISAGCLITELAPWPSLVQRFGRCARYGGEGRVLVVDRGRDEGTVKPYRAEELDSAWQTLQGLDEVGVASLEAHEQALSEEARAKLYPYAPAHLLLRREFDELFDTTPDLSGADLDISRFIRSDEERDLQVFWLDLEKGVPPPADRLPHRCELCAVPFLTARNWLCGEETKTNRKPRLLNRFRRAAWTWDWIDGEWIEADRARLLSGRIVCVAANCGGYRTDRGFDPDSKAAVPVVPAAQRPVSSEGRKVDEADSSEERDDLSFEGWKTIAWHSSEVIETVREIAEHLQISGELRDILRLAAQWHDWGKAHPAFQHMLLRNREVTKAWRRQLWAKADNGRKGKPRYFADDDERDERRGFRHELASALALFATLEAFAPQHPALLGRWSDAVEAMGQVVTSPSGASSSPPATVQLILDCSAEAFDLLVYLIAAHHGKVRVALHAGPKDQEYRAAEGNSHGLPIRGVCQGDRLPAVMIARGEPAAPEVSLTLEPATMGLSPSTGASWRERCLGLLERFGPAGLAYLESLLRAADVRASRLKTNDPALTSEATG
ncbi:MAG TPA: CRISPR-associated helicase Cas3' [Pirellulales bacterium]|jgi:CRISPR-associated endonuclease/helicase Cas3|nr:CRISPR-associated helicase Cas3' [Pirellulales bacterium]